VTHEYGVVLVMVLQNTASAFSNVCSEALTVEYSKGKPYEKIATLQSCLWGSCAAAAFVGAAFGGYMLDHGINKHQMFALAGCIPLFCMVSTGLSHEDPVSLKAQAATESHSVFFGKIWEAFNPPDDGDTDRPRWSVGKVCLFLIIFFSVPDTSATNYFYLTNHLHMGEKVLAVITTVAMGTYLFGVVCYEFLLKDSPIQSFLRNATIMTAGVTAIAILLYTRANLALGIPDEVFVVTDSAFMTAIKTVAQLPLMTLMAAMCPDAIEGTLFSVFTSIANLGGVLGGWMGALLTLMFGITSTQFHLMWALCVTCALMQLTPIYFLYLLPSKEQYAEIKKAKNFETEKQYTDYEKDPRLND